MWSHMICVISIPDSEFMTVPHERQIFHRFIFLTYYLVFFTVFTKKFLNFAIAAFLRG